MSELGSKLCEVFKQVVAVALEEVRMRRGVVRVDGVTVERFVWDCGNNVDKLWDRMLSGSFFPALVRVVEISKEGGRGARVLGALTVQD